MKTLFILFRLNSNGTRPYNVLRFITENWSFRSVLWSIKLQKPQFRFYFQMFSNKMYLKNINQTWRFNSTTITKTQTMEWTKTLCNIVTRGVAKNPNVLVHLIHKQLKLIHIHRVRIWSGPDGRGFNPMIRARGEHWFD